MDMKTLVTVSMAVLLLLSLPLAARAGDIDGIKPLLCSVITVIECTPEDGCLKVDFEKKTVTSVRESDGNRNSDINRLEHVGGLVILQGVDEGIQEVRDGVGWTAAISKETGNFMLTASGHEVAFIVYGACTPLP